MDSVRLIDFYLQKEHDERQILSTRNRPIINAHRVSRFEGNSRILTNLCPLVKAYSIL